MPSGPLPHDLRGHGESDHTWSDHGGLPLHLRHRQEAFLWAEDSIGHHTMNTTVKFLLFSVIHFTKALGLLMHISAYTANDTRIRRRLKSQAQKKVAFNGLTVLICSPNLLYASDIKFLPLITRCYRQKGHMSFWTLFQSMKAQGVVGTS